MAGGCLVEAHARIPEPVVAVEVDTAPEPPPPVVETMEVRPGYIWIGGRYNWAGGRWVWMNGHYEAERVGYVWAPGSWQVQGRRRVWVEGTWRAGGAPASEVRDHRTPAPVPVGPVVRDHRHD
jgi:hypothetical protein